MEDPQFHQPEVMLAPGLAAQQNSAVWLACQRALSGNADDIREFLRSGWQVAVQRDQETLTVKGLAELADDAQKQAAAQTDAAKQEADQQQEPVWQADKLETFDAETQRLLTEAAQPNAPSATVLGSTRKAALRLLTRGGPWVQSAATSALSETDAAVRSFLAVGLPAAIEQDDRASVNIIARTSPIATQRTAAVVAQAGDYTTVKQFVRTKAYPGKPNDDRQEINRIIAAAGVGTVVYTRGSAALTADSQGDTEALQRFLEQGQYDAAVQDDRIAVNRALATGGPEVKAALSGPVSYLRRFLTVELPKAQVRDADTATHVAQIDSYLANADQSAYLARQNANQAAESAALARQAADEAHQWHDKAVASAAQAAEAAQQARQFADAAQRSADQAAESAKRARDAANQAAKSAKSANASAANASASASHARDMAAEAQRDADQARADAIEAQKDADAAERAAQEAKAAKAKFNQTQDQRENVGTSPNPDTVSPFGIDSVPEDLKDDPKSGGKPDCQNLYIGEGPPIAKCTVTIEHHITGTMRFFTYICPQGATQREQCTRVEIGTSRIDMRFKTSETFTTWEALKDALVAIAKGLIDDFRKCAMDKGWSRTEACIWVAASIIPPTRLARIGELVAQGAVRAGKGAEYLITLTDGSYLYAEVVQGGMLKLRVEVQAGSKGQGLGATMFDSAMDYYGSKVTSVQGFWDRSEKLTDNLDSFNAAIRANKTVEQAAKETFTGKQAAKFGFTDVDVLVLEGPKGEYTKVVVEFF